MKKLAGLQPERVFDYFEKISSIPRGSGNMKGISDFCMAFAEAHSLRAVRDDANNVVIYKDAAPGYEQAEPVILQGHLDMVCQKNETSRIDFERDGLEIYADGDFIKAKGTSLGADNGIAVAMVLAVLESDTISHPAIEAVFTTDEEIGMIGAGKLDTGLLRGKKMINLDSEEQDVLTVSCAGGSDFAMKVPTERVSVSGTQITLQLHDLKGGHSGVEINSGRVNAAILAGRVLNHLEKEHEFFLVSINAGDKVNAIPRACTVKIVTEEPKAFSEGAKAYLALIQKEISSREPDFSFSLSHDGEGTFSAMCSEAQQKVTFALLCAPNGVLEMSADISGLVETSLNLGILKTENDLVLMQFSLRSNKQTALDFLEEKMTGFAAMIGCEMETSSHYPPWEYKEDSVLRKLYQEVYFEEFKEEVKVEAIHAGLECGVFASNIPGLDCIAIGPQMFDVHTDGERLSISSTGALFSLLLKLLARCQ